jgi:hypothetical protein
MDDSPINTLHHKEYDTIILMESCLEIVMGWNMDGMNRVGSKPEQHGWRVRLAALHSNFRPQKTLNPDGYTTNLTAWLKGL